MIVLDENMEESLRDRLGNLGMRIRQIGVDLAPKGIKDDNVIPLLHQLRSPTFFTQDSHYWDRRLCHLRYCLVYLDVWPQDAAKLIRAFLRQAQFETWNQRRGCVVRATKRRLAIWRLKATQIEILTL
jgi:hypothetical protein